jgi:acyl-lipid omega-6 desaturase (Delta-12 desaturase)
MSSDGIGAADASWRTVLAPHMIPRLRPALVDVGTSVVAYVGLMAAMFVVFRISYLLVLVLAIPAAGFLVRTFIVFHECAHGSWRGRFHYRLFRNPFVMFLFGPFWVLLIGQRLVTRGMRPRLRHSVLGTDLSLAVVIGELCWLVGWKEFVLVQSPALVLAGAAGVWLFYVQHQFEDAYWQTSDAWNFDEAALQGSSRLDLPPILRFFTGNIGLHHLHHLSARIPNYNLQAAHESGGLEPVTTLSLRDGFRAVRLKLWDSDQRRLVTFREANRNTS